MIEDFSRSVATVDEQRWARLGVLRLILALLVAAGHATWFQRETVPALEFIAAFGGTPAVVGFLMISGFSIAASLERVRKDFYWRRLLRIYPTYAVALLTATTLEALCNGHFTAPHRSFDSVGWPALLGNMLFLQTFVVKPVAFDGPVWSLAVEAFYYMLAPIIMLMPRRFIYGCIALSVAAFLLPKRSDLGLAYLLASKFNALNYAWPWLTGVLLWQIRATVQARPFAYAAWATFGAGIVYAGPLTGGGYSPITFFVTLICMWPWTNLTTGKTFYRVANLCGDLSYPAYLLHLPILIALAMAGLSESLPLFICTVMFVSAILGLIWEPIARTALQKARKYVPVRL
jgi:peptidoglycan/LPS O-acetylase OafA/YrhL